MTQMKPVLVARTEATLPKTLDARHITDADGRAFIDLDGQVYTLRITRSGKLILTK